MKVIGAKIILKWGDGRTTTIGTLDVDFDKNSLKYKWSGRWRQRLGWEIVREGFRIMFPFRKWKEETGKGASDDQD